MATVALDIPSATGVGALGGKRIAGVPSAAAVVAVDRTGVVLRPASPFVLARVPPRWPQQPALVLSMPQRDPVLVHVHGGEIASTVLQDHGLLLLHEGRGNQEEDKE